VGDGCDESDLEYFLCKLILMRRNIYIPVEFLAAQIKEIVVLYFAKTKHGKDG